MTRTFTDRAEAIEQPMLRTAYTKTYDLLNGTRMLTCCTDPIHYRTAASNWEEIDLRFTQEAGLWVLRTAPYTLTVDPAICQIEFASEAGTVSMQLIGLDGATPTAPTTMETRHASLWLRDVGRDFDLEIRLRTKEIEIYKLLKTAAAPTTMTWLVDEPLTRGELVLTPERTEGRDNYAGTETADRVREFPRNWRRHCLMAHRKSVDDLSHRGRRRYTVEEVFTGQVVLRDRTTRIPTPTPDVRYPVYIDTTVTITNTVTADDGSEYYTGGGLWYNALSYIYVSATRYPAWRFSGVTIPSGQTLDSASLRINVAIGGAATGVWAGQDEDTAPVWTNNSATHKVSTMNKTTATTVLTGLSTAGEKTFDVLGICQEIINRGGWASGNAIRIGGHTIVGTQAQVYDVSSGGAGSRGQLTIVYTAGGGGTAVTYHDKAIGRGIARGIGF